MASEGAMLLVVGLAAFVGVLLLAWPRRGDALTAAARAVASDDGHRSAIAQAWAALEGRVRTLPAVRQLQDSAEAGAARAEALSDLPELLDIVTLGLSAGLSFDAALELYCERYDTSLAHAFAGALASWRLGVCDRAQGLAGLAESLDLQSLRRLSGAVGESIEFGVPLAEALSRQADLIREEQRVEVEERIEKAPVKMLLPLGTLIVPAMLLAILGPLLASALRLG
ncbi:MAG: type II secretion system F family protein [Atopobiaceae bacterium]|nr:type II secretion system F family protein [Atopobiaceae bacterium]